MSWKSAPKRSAWPRVSSSASGSSSSARSSPPRSPAMRSGPPRSRASPRAPRACGRGRRGGGWGSGPRRAAPRARAGPRRGRLELVHQAEAPQRIRPGDDPRSSASWRSPAGLRGEPARAAPPARSSPARSRAELGAEPRGAQQPQRVVGTLCPDTARRRRASRSASRPCGSIGSPPASGIAIALTVKSRSPRSASIVSPRSGVTSICQSPS